MCVFGCLNAHIHMKSLLLSAPEYLLCLQNGKFDQPNRLFHRYCLHSILNIYTCTCVHVFHPSCFTAVLPRRGRMSTQIMLMSRRSVMHYSYVSTHVHYSLTLTDVWLDTEIYILYMKSYHSMVLELHYELRLKVLLPFQLIPEFYQPPGDFLCNLQVLCTYVYMYT